MKKYSMKINNELFEACIIEFSANHAKVDVNGVEFVVEIGTDPCQPETRIVQMEKPVPSVPQMRSEAGKNSDVVAPIPGVIISVQKKEGDFVHAGDVIITLEAMKMETEVMANVDGIIQKINVKEKSPVQEGEVLATIQQVIKEAPQAPAPQPTHTPQPMPQAPAPQPVQTSQPAQTGNKTIITPLPGIILDIKVQIGEKVKADQVLFVLEAMKMESEIFSAYSGTVTKILVNKGDNVIDGQVLLEIGD